MASDCRTLHRSIRLLSARRTISRWRHRRFFLSGRPTHYPTTKCWTQVDSLHKRSMGAFFQFPKGSNSGINIAKPWKTMVSEAFFFDTKTNCRDIILCTFGAKSGPRDFRAFATHRKEAFRGHRPVHPQIASNSCAILCSFSTLLIVCHDCECLKTLLKKLIVFHSCYPQIRSK